jgi:hypothetical protein
MENVGPGPRSQAMSTSNEPRNPVEVLAEEFLDRA